MDALKFRRLPAASRPLSQVHSWKAGSNSQPVAVQNQMDEVGEIEGTYRTKVIQFLGRSVPIILQNDNGPCPLIAISNILLLRNNISISPDTSEISLTKLLSLVGERLLDSNTIHDKDEGYIENQQQNIHDAIELLPRLATGIDVNLHFSKIDDFEFTPERSVFDLLGIELYHGWIVDPQDTETSRAVGSKSFNTLMSEIVSLKDVDTSERKKKLVPDAASSAATLTCSSTFLSKESCLCQDIAEGQKGDVEEYELSRALQISKIDDLPISDKTMEIAYPGNALNASADCLEAPGCIEDQAPRDQNTCICTDTVSLLSPAGKPEMYIPDNVPKVSDLPGPIEDIKHVEGTSCSAIGNESDKHASSGKEGDPTGPTHCEPGLVVTKDARLCTDSSDAVSFTCDKNISKDSIGSLEDVSSRTSEPTYEEGHASQMVGPAHACKEPLPDCEVHLSEEAERTTKNVSNEIKGGHVVGHIAIGSDKSVSGINARESEIIQNFLKNNASQLTVYGLFCLQEGVKERELCVFFRNNHFSTMFKFKDELYLLVTDQGYINQPELVWEKLNEVNGDTMFMTGSFTVFSASDRADTKWSEQNAVAKTAEYLATVDGMSGRDSSSDLQLAIALQQQEFEQQPQCSDQPSAERASNVAVPQVSRGNYPKQETKLREKCCVM